MCVLQINAVSPGFVRGLVYSSPRSTTLWENTMCKLSRPQQNPAGILARCCHLPYGLVVLTAQEEEGLSRPPETSIDFLLCLPNKTKYTVNQ